MLYPKDFLFFSFLKRFLLFMYLCRENAHRGVEGEADSMLSLGLSITTEIMT